MAGKERKCFGKCPRCGTEHEERRDWNYDECRGEHWFYEYYSCPECGMRYTEMYKYVGTYYEEES